MHTQTHTVAYHAHLHTMLPCTRTHANTHTEAIGGAGLIIQALPAQKTPAFLKAYKSLISPDVLICSTSKVGGAKVGVSLVHAHARTQ